MINSLDDFVSEFKKIQSMGWIKTHRNGNTGIGKTLEDLLGIPENNIDGPDFGEYELKSKRLNANSMLTLFTKSPQPRGANAVLLKKYGYPSDAYDNNDLVLHSTLCADRFVRIGATGKSLIIKHNTDKIWLASETGDENIFWDKEYLRKAFEQKYRGKFVYVYADSRGTGADEEFLFRDAYEVSGFSYDDFIALLTQGKIFIDLRIGQYHHGARKGKLHDHGTAFRIKDSDEKDLFKNKKKIA